MRDKALKYINPKLTAPIIKDLLDSPDTAEDLKEWLLKEIAKVCAVPKKNFKDSKKEQAAFKEWGRQLIEKIDKGGD